MAPSVQQIPEEIPSVHPEKLNAVVKETPIETTEEIPAPTPEPEAVQEPKQVEEEKATQVTEAPKEEAKPLEPAETIKEPEASQETKSLEATETSESVQKPEAATTQEQETQEKPKETPFVKRQIDIEGGKTDASYPAYLPTWNHGQKYPPLEPFTYTDPGLSASPTFPDLLPAGSKVQKLTPSIGSEVTGVQLSSLSKEGRDQLALLVAQRKVVAFRDQDFASLPLKEALDFGGHFGRHHIHPTSGSPTDYPELHIVHRYGQSSDLDSFLAGRNSSVSWHSDVSYEAQPPGITFLYILDTPEVGGDTAFASQVEAYNRLSESLKERLHGLEALHSGFEQAQASRDRDGVVRREPVKNVHPLVRTHPVTGEKALYINQGFTRSIVGLKKEESEALLAFLFNHISRGIDFQARVRWAPKTVVVWDNRATVHSATLDWTTGERRHLARITPQAEKPFETPYVKPEVEVKA